MEIGSILKQFRKAAGMSIRDLAEAAKCSIGMISKIETNHVSPTIRMLERLCAALGVASTDVLRPPVAPVGKPTRIGIDRVECAVVMTWSGIRMLQADPKSEMGTALILQFKPEAQTSWRRSLISHNQICFVLKGKVALDSEGESYPLKTGEGIYFNAHHDHRWTNLGDSLAEVMVFNPYRFILFEQREENLRWKLHARREKRNKGRTLGKVSP